MRIKTTLVDDPHKAKRDPLSVTDVVDRVSPVDIDAERSILGSMLLPNENPFAIQEARKLGLAPDNFRAEKTPGYLHRNMIYTIEANQ